MRTDYTQMVISTETFVRPIAGDITRADKSWGVNAHLRNEAEGARVI